MDIIQFSPQISASSSRLVQESINVGQGSSIYGKLSAFIDNNISGIDCLAEFIADGISMGNIKGLYDEQYFKKDQKFKSLLTRNIYLNSEKQAMMEKERFVCGLVSRVAVETAIKYGCRAIQNWANEKDQFVTCEQVYSVLVSYINTAHSDANKEKAFIELSKIRNSFPLRKSDKFKLAEKYRKTGIAVDSLDVSSVLTQENSAVKDSLAYFLTVLNRQLYGVDSDADKKLVNYYSLIDLVGSYGKEIQAENQYSYDEIAADQVAYLQMSRGLMKNVFAKSATLNVQGILARTDELAKYDPYAIRRKKIKGAAKGGVLTVGGILSSNPEIALNGVATAIAQFVKDDEVLSVAKTAMLSYGVSGNEFDAIANTSNTILNKSIENDLML